MVYGIFLPCFQSIILAAFPVCDELPAAEVRALVRGEVVPDFRSLRGDIAFRPLLACQSPVAKIPFQTRIWRLIARVREASTDVLRSNQRELLSRAHRVRNDAGGEGATKALVLEGTDKR